MSKIPKSGYLAVLLAVMSLVLVGCGNQDSSQKRESNDTPPSQYQPQKGVDPMSQSDETRIQDKMLPEADKADTQTTQAPAVKPDDAE